MGYSLVVKAVIVLLLFLLVEGKVDRTIFHQETEALGWPSTLSAYDEVGYNIVDEDDGVSVRRSLYWRSAVHYYISYGALSANRVPCPPRSGRSYYTHDCHKARTPANPYNRGCSCISHCRR
ncbi:hypothetical protein K2173_028050 [Erythroxylum novogranatense]|uniref:Protein RALF-like 34 n=1 Tax=Erythroxylum novogranatense TaxID=1862640 RepID=A0AAV8U0Z8_9ROSI|nr:hypothetical protein K2173_028050 [Erythroxylum novogranatense]